MHTQVSSIEIKVPTHCDLISRSITTLSPILSLNNIPAQHSRLSAFISAE
jgi:hypothetical protein